MSLRIPIFKSTRPKRHTPEEKSVRYHHRLVWAQSSERPLRALCLHCGEELERHWSGWRGKSTGSRRCVV